MNSIRTINRKLQSRYKLPIKVLSKSIQSPLQPFSTTIMARATMPIAMSFD